jgi:signal transduction histidine kinase
MQEEELNSLEISRIKTNESLEDERTKTDNLIDSKIEIVEEESDEKIEMQRAATDIRLEQERAAADSEKKAWQTEATEKSLYIERERSDKAQIVARLEEDRIHEKERFKKRLVAEALLESERKDTDNKLQEERKKTDAVQEFTNEALITRDQFLAVVSHDLKNPLSSISMGASLIRIALSKGPSETSSLFKFLEMIERNVANMDRMISDLLDVERMTSNKLSLNVEKVNIVDLLNECAELFAPVVLSKSCTMKVEPLAEPLFAEIDQEKILQVLSNLVGNALKFSPKGSAISLSARKQGRDVEISVSDNGPGIPENKKAQIFERFSQLKNNDRRGLGLGLFIARWIVEAHNGQIGVKSEAGKGSTFTFTLQASESVHAQSPSASP